MAGVPRYHLIGGTAKCEPKSSTTRKQLERLSAEMSGVNTNEARLRLDWTAELA